MEKINEEKLYKAEEIALILGLSKNIVSLRMTNWQLPSVNISIWKEQKRYRMTWRQLKEFIEWLENKW